MTEAPPAAPSVVPQRRESAPTVRRESRPEERNDEREYHVPPLPQRHKKK